jgi:hypothetical protein
VIELDNFVKKAYRADLCRMIFVPNTESLQGVFWTGPAHYREMLFADLNGTLVEELIDNQECKSLTLPSSLLCPNPFKAAESNDLLKSVTGEEYEAIKLISVHRESRGDLLAVIELGWLGFATASSVHENQAYLQKKDERMVKTVAEVLDHTYFKLSLLSSRVKNKVAYEMLSRKRRALFNRWKRVTFLQQFASGMFEEKENLNNFANTQH